MEQESLVLKGERRLVWEENEIPALQEDEVLIKTIAGAISIGAEIPQYMKSDLSDENPVYPMETGYESYGEIAAAGEKIRNLKVGDRVLAFYGHKSFDVAKENEVIRVPEDIDCRDALLTILSCDAAKGVMKLQPNPGDNVLVSGMGTMGLLTVYFLKQYYKVEQIDIIEPDFSRAQLALLLGANNIRDKDDTSYENKYMYGIECSSYNYAFEKLQKAVTKNSSICILSDGNKETFELQPAFYEKELNIVGSSDGWDYLKHSQWHFDQMRKNSLPLSNLFELEIQKEELIQCFEDLASGKIAPIKVLVNY